ncbi:uncharacterized protein LOC111051723 isoform X2 [Nilaparvata lugens]|uniref:uncharacterized protein LOC111051723 isoform X2 n=2 Tax=Nilaparvata lugens TaxID=108931 RepID=UPI00193D8FA8|nr:uncharacterized protein LOC111051723 isoform X2 [Nilaparvata lugens]
MCLDHIDSRLVGNFTFQSDVKAPVESRIPVFCQAGGGGIVVGGGGSVKAAATRLSRPLATLSNKVRAHLGGGQPPPTAASNDVSSQQQPAPPPVSSASCRRSELSLTELTQQQEWLFRKTALQDDTPTMSGASKHSSFELDESLGILTPDQMAESPLCEEMPSLLLMSADCYQEQDHDQEGYQGDCYQEQEQDQDRYQEGYQGDGECSRPASPGSKPNPMTDSDFFTESDADMHEELQSALSGDRKAQVIDGRLYQQARCPSFLAAEEMDSSGVYSDTDRTPRAEREEFSPAKLSSMIMEQVNTIKNLVVSVPMEDEDDTASGEGEAMQQEAVVDREAMSETKEDTQPQHQEAEKRIEHKEVKSPVTQQSRTPSREEDTSAPALKKHKMPKRNVVSKIKTMISSSTTSSGAGKGPGAGTGTEERRKRGGGCSRWDAVMNKIAQGQAEAGQRPSLKQVKSRVFAGLQVPPPPPPQRKAIAASQQTPLKAKRRTRTRGSECSLQTPTNGKSHNSSRNSSISDLSKASPHSVRSKKRESGGRSRSPQSDNSTLSTAAQSRRPSTLPTTPPQRNGNGPASGVDVKSSNVRKSTSKRSLNSTTSKQQPLRDQNRVSGGGKTPEPSSAPVVSTSSPHDLPSPLDLSSSQSPSHEALLPHLQHASAGFEALGVLVNYLVHNLDAFSTPQLKSDLEKMKSDWLKTKLELEETEVSCSRLQDELMQQKKSQEELVSQHMHQLASHQTQQQMQIAEIVRNHEESLSEMEKRLQEQAKVLRAQYDEELDHCRETHRCELATLQQSAGEQLQRVQSAANQREAELVQRLTAIEAEHADLKDQSRRFMESMHMDKDTKLQVTANRCKELQDEVESLRTVLELRSSELQELRKQNEILQVDAELLPPTMQKLMTAQARVEDLQVQLERRTNAEKQLIQENRLLIESVHQESKQKKRLSQHNEELQWKLKQNSEVVNALVTDLSSKSSAMQAFTPQATGTPKRNTAEMLEFFMSRNSMQQNNEQSIVVTDCSPPQSPKVKGVIEKSDSVSWVLEMDESPEHVVNRLVRRAHSFRQTGSGSPSPSPAHHTLPNPHKRQRSRMSQSLSASSSSLKGKKPARTRSFSADSDGSDVARKWDDCDEGKSYSPIDRSDDNDDLIVVESVGDDMLSFIELESKNSVQNERMITGEICSSDSEGSIRSRRLEARDDLLLINRDDGLRERGILPKDAGGEAMISEETSDDEEDEEESRDSDVEGSGSLSGDEGSFSGSNSEFADGLCERKIKTDLRQVSKPVKKLSQLSSDALTMSGMDIVNWTEEAALPKALQSEG